MTAAAKKARSKPATPRSNKGKVSRPTIMWALLARELVKDQSNRTISAINIVEELYLPSDVFEHREERVTVVDVGDPLTLAITLDWRWPELVSASFTKVQIDWYTPSGRGFVANGGNMSAPIEKPSGTLRTHIEIRLKDLPIAEEGIYHFDILLNGESAAKVPVRIRALQDQQGAPPAKRTKRKLSPKSKNPTPRSTPVPSPGD